MGNMIEEFRTHKLSSILLILEEPVIDDLFLVRVCVLADACKST